MFIQEQTPVKLVYDSLATNNLQNSTGRIYGLPNGVVQTNLF